MCVHTHTFLFTFYLCVCIYLHILFYFTFYFYFIYLFMMLQDRGIEDIAVGVEHVEAVVAVEVDEFGCRWSRRPDAATPVCQVTSLRQQPGLGLGPSLTKGDDGLVFLADQGDDVVGWPSLLMSTDRQRGWLPGDRRGRGGTKVRDGSSRWSGFRGTEISPV